MRIVEPFYYETSTVDWCEPNYQLSPFIAEFFNTLTSIPICIVGLAHMKIYGKYAKLRDPRSRIIIYLLIGVGFGSTLFHMTLSTVGQLADELFILWLIALGEAWYWPEPAFPSKTIKRSHFQIVIVGIAIISTVLCHTYPFLNHLALALLALPQYIAISIAYFLQPHPSQLRTHLYTSCSITWFAALFFWIFDMSLCHRTMQWNFPYFHAIWHLLSAVALCNTLNMSIYYELESCPQFHQFPLKLKQFPKFMGYFAYQYLKIEFD